MSVFNFSETAGAAQSTSKPQLKGNNIYDVTFDGVEIKDVAGKKDPTAMYKILNIKFSNEDGYFSHSLFEPKEEDSNRRKNEFTDNQGVTSEVTQLSNNETMMLLFKHLIDAVNPELGALIDKGEAGAQMKVSGSELSDIWVSLCNVIKNATDPGIGTKVQLKLIVNKKGEPIFPYFAGLNKEGKTYMKSNFIGAKLFWSPSELKQLQKVATAKPTPVSNGFDLGKVGVTTGSETVGMDATMDFKL